MRLSAHHYVELAREEITLDPTTRHAHPVADKDALPHLLHGKETKVWGDQGYKGQRAAIRKVAPQAQDLTNKGYRHNGEVDEVEKAKNRNKSHIRARVEHVFGIMKRVFGFQKVRYRGLAKNLHRLQVTAALINLLIGKRRLLRAQGACAC